MNHYLVVFDRSTGRVLRRTQFSDSNAALEARFEQEREYRDNPDIEVVVLSARSVDALKHTHGRYFKNFDQLASSA
jgi:hypothetical protein